MRFGKKSKAFYYEVLLAKTSEQMIVAIFTPSPVLSYTFTRALAFAANAHEFQVRKDGTPYIAHLLAVSSLVLEAGGTEDEAVAALLRDYLEDVNGAEPLDIECKFGTQVLAAVQHLTATDKTEYRGQMLISIPGTVLISAADSLHNLRGYASGKAAIDQAKAEHYIWLTWLYAIAPRVPMPWVTEMAALIAACGHSSPFDRDLIKARRAAICDREIRSGESVTQVSIAKKLGVNVDTVLSAFDKLRELGAPLQGGSGRGLWSYGSEWGFRAAFMDRV